MYTITVANAGPSDATSVSLSDTWPAGFTRGTVTPPAGATCDTSTSTTDFTCDLGTIVKSASKAVTVTYTVPSATTGSQTNTATVSSAVTDPATGSNNSASDTNTVATSANLSVTKTDGESSVDAGSATVHTYTITVANAGPSDATSVSLSDTWPAGFTRGTVTSSQGTCTGSPSFTCDLATIASGGSATVSVNYTVPSSTTGSQTNTSTVSSAVTDPNTGNNSASDTNTVNDVTAPIVTLVTPADGSTTTDTTPTFSGTAGVLAGDSASVTVRIYAGNTVSGSLVQTLTTTRGAGGAYGVDSAVLLPGKYTAQASQSDGINTGTSNANTFIVQMDAKDDSATVDANSTNNVIDVVANDIYGPARPSTRPAAPAARPRMAGKS